ncbi:MAG: GHMP kinase [Armatimonadetes bacterium]|nr:GHMP kinase [Armatimonadota bacterium]
MDSRLFTPPVAPEVRWRQFEERVLGEFQGFFDAESPIVGARAPGRLDVMGGVADYSGSVVLEMPISEAAYVAWQWRDDRLFRILSLAPESTDFQPYLEISLDTLVNSEGRLRPISEVRAALSGDSRTRWASYLVGCFYMMLHAYTKVTQGIVDSRLGERGANILLESDVPLGAGVSSSAAIEVATMHALSEAAGIHPSNLTFAAWCQKAENHIVGAPCGIMDQVTSALGAEGMLLALRCQPHNLLGNYRIPRGWRFVGIDSRVKHSVGGTAYTKARVGAFMGLKVIQLESGGRLLENYLCQMKPDEFATYRELIPDTITGAEYTALYGLLPDTITRVLPEETYHPRLCAEHPILENDRVLKFMAVLRYVEECELMGEDTQDPAIMWEVGQLMYAAHASYSDRLNLGSPETDLIVHLVKKRGAESGLFGAKITGGGAGGTVAILCLDTPEAEQSLLDVCTEYQRHMQMEPYLFMGSSPGAISFGARMIERGREF